MGLLHARFSTLTGLLNRELLLILLLCVVCPAPTLPLRDGLGLLRPVVCFGTSSLVVELFLRDEVAVGGLLFLVSLPRRDGGRGLGDLLSFDEAWPGTSSFGPKREDSRRESVFGCGAVF